MNLLHNVKESWIPILQENINKLDDCKVLKQNDNYLPEYNNIFNAFKYFELDETKLVFLGQDPYINGIEIDGKFVPQAMGLSFSVPDTHTMPPSLKNIFKEIKNSYPDVKEGQDLTRWAKEEKILLLNSALTVKKGKSNSHQKYWTPITNDIISYISDNTENVVFLLLGNDAKSKSKYIDDDKHIIITGVHPSPLSAHRGFFGSEIFKIVNDELENRGKGPINWNN